MGEPRPITHPVKFYEKGDRPLEIVSSRQWFVRTLPHRDRLLDLGEQLRWHPAHMAHRYRAWVEGLTGDWNISRQRFFGVPFPVWYPVDDDGSVDYDRPLLPERGPAAGRSLHRRARRLRARTSGDGPAASSATPTSWTPGPPPPSPPMIAGGWEDDPDLFARVFPMDLRPQAHDIIRTWLFSTVVRSELELGPLPVVRRRHLGMGARPRHARRCPSPRATW